MEPGERRRHPRRSIDLPALVALGAERPLPVGTVVDLSRGGVLVRFPEQSLAVEVGARVLVTLPHPAGSLHLLGDVRRLARGTDHRFYLAVELHAQHAEDEVRLADLLEADLLEPGCNAPAGASGPPDVGTACHPERSARSAGRHPSAAREGARLGDR